MADDAARRALRMFEFLTLKPAPMPAHINLASIVAFLLARRILGYLGLVRTAWQSGASGAALMSLPTGIIGRTSGQRRQPVRSPCTHASLKRDPNQAADAISIDWIAGQHTGTHNSNEGEEYEHEAQERWFYLDPSQRFDLWHWR
jgi:hypothetical protein